MALINKLKAIGDAIRAKTGKTDPLTMDAMVTEINGIESGGGGAETDAFLMGTLTEISNDRVTSLRKYALYMLTTSLVSVDFPNVTTVNDYSFGSCNVMTQANLPSLRVINGSAFNCCFALESVDFPLLEEIASSGFSSCKGLKTIYFPNLKMLGSRAFSDCTGLVKAVLPSLTSISSYAFYRCTSLRTVDLGCSSLSNYVFNGCSSLTALIVRDSKVTSFTGTNVFTGTPIASGTGYIYVPSSLLYSFQTVSGWKTYASQLRVLENYTVDGTITGELDESKI